MNDRVLSKIFSQLNVRIERGLLSGHTFLGANGEQIKSQISGFYGGQITTSIAFKQRCNGEEQELIIAVSNSGKEVRKILRIWAIRDREIKEPIEIMGYLACIDPEELYTSWEKQSDLAIRETVEMAFLAYSRKREILKHGTKAASTGIMARNWSHNIGSHVITYWAGETLPQIAKSLDNLHFEMDKAGLFSSKPLRVIKKAEKVTEDSKKLFQYIQGRMDFLAEITTSVPSSELTMDFKEELLKPMLDTSRKKHNEPIGVPPLLEFIASSEGLQLQDNNVAISALTKRSRVSIPNGIIGAHAVYTILENFIRNAAKHYKGKAASTENELFMIELRDPKNAEWQKDYFEVRLWDQRENSCDQNVLKKILTFLSSDEETGQLVDSSNKLRPEGWGFKEMRICANFLRKRSSEELFERMTDGEPPLVAMLCGDKLLYSRSQLGAISLPCSTECDCSNDSDYRSRLGLCLYLLKPKHLLIQNTKCMKMETDEDNLFQIDIGLHNYHEGEMSTTEKPHRIFLSDEDRVISQAEQDTKLPCRIMKLENAPSPLTDDFYLNTYKSFIKERMDNNRPYFPSFLFSGGGKEAEYKKLFEDDSGNLSKYGKALTPEKIVADFPNRDASDRLAIFYHHAEVEDRKTIEQFTKNPKVIYFQPISAKYTFSNKVKYAPQTYKMREQFLLELVESVVSDVIVVDERISKLAEQTWGNQQRVGEVLRRMGVFIIPVNRKNVTLTDLSEKLGSIPSGLSLKGHNIDRCYDTMNIFESDTLKNAFFVIHQGILDKLKKQEVDIEDFFNSVKCKWKIVASGRGVPQSLFRSARFVEISAVLKMLEGFDKHGLVQMLFASRNPKTYEEAIRQ